MTLKPMSPLFIFSRTEDTWSSGEVWGSREGRLVQDRLELDILRTVLVLEEGAELDILRILHTLIELESNILRT